ncbi:MAG: ribosomal protein S18-alanine N-acetyltransferase [Noviherbaspirillum sp.]
MSAAREVGLAALTRMARMQTADLDEVVRIEYSVYPFPWMRQNFVDSLDSGYDAWVMRDAQGRICGYFLLMMAVDEAHLLNITIDPALHGRGLGLALLDHATALARRRGMQSILLEVRPSNQRALGIYRRYGYGQIGSRKNYYPAAQGQREDAIVMRLVLS